MKEEIEVIPIDALDEYKKDLVHAQAHREAYRDFHEKAYVELVKHTDSWKRMADALETIAHHLRVKS